MCIKFSFCISIDMKGDFFYGTSQSGNMWREYCEY